MASRRRVLLLSPGLLAAFALAGCSIADDGPRTAQTRDVASFTRVVNRDSVDLRLHVGAPRRVRVRAGEKVIGDVRTDVRDGTLHVAFDHDGIFGGGAVVDAWVPKLTGVEACGSGDIDVDGIRADAFAVRSDGSSDVALRGRTNTLSVDVEGSGDTDLADLDARDAHVAVHGSGDADVRADRRLDVAVEGSGDVRYYGRPAVTRQLDGSGVLRRAGE
jgi:putative autotransporter adhesin-like protein